MILEYKQWTREYLRSNYTCVDPHLSQNWTSDRSCSLCIPDISLMELLDPDEYVCRRSMSDVSKFQTERASESRLNWRRKMDLDTFGIGYNFGLLSSTNGYLVPHLWFGLLLAFRYDFGNIDAIFGVQVMKFRHLFKVAIKLKGDIGLKSDLQFGIGLRIGWW